ncbi:polysialyltransferase family glycosyltransferase [Flavobacterium sp. RSB2_4_14]|uniref:polysialyltransferase family glycosyltransferase n=1 Tax=Flavobacterium sp. RSB2_4_14 TaxID=3447665 RepID=UPI003F4161E6
MKEKICFFVHTEYHLLLSIHAMQYRYADTNLYEVELILKRTTKSSRLKQDLDLNSLLCKFRVLDFDLNLKRKLSNEEKQQLDTVLNLDFSEFNFFQEQDPITIIIINHFKKKGTKINLYQDGLKPYIAHTMSFSPALLLNNIKQNLWIRKNGYPITDYFSFVNCKNYGFLKGIDQLFLTFPKAYINWKRILILTITPEFTDSFVQVLKKVFKWEDALLEERNRVIFFMNQPMHDDGSFEVKVLQQLQNKYPEVTIYIKNHPLTSQVKLIAYKKLNNIEIINSKIPAELFISQLDNSIVLSVCSTSMFINNPSCKFYYIFDVATDNNIERLKKYKVINPSDHIITVNQVDAIEF